MRAGAPRPDHNALVAKDDGVLRGWICGVLYRQ